ncbi:hypothetical protein BC941DRAFT_465621 [Chlamydoabsidia padenii]|nr:hypothetical protein BC941DRAFT_465621 [Chlamydoabsidia padenii]
MTKSPHMSGNEIYRSAEDGQQRQSITPDDRNDGLALIERRKRNKTASAKYRQKKNRQQTEMKKTIHQLAKQDCLLKKQLTDLQAENQKIKLLNVNLRERIAAKNVTSSS